MVKRLTILVLILSVTALPAQAKKQTAAQAFTEKYNAAAAKGPAELLKFKTKISNEGSDAEVEMLRNLKEGKTADGKALPKDRKAQGQKAKGSGGGIPGYPADAEDQDLSDWIVETDGKGNVTGFKPSDWYDRDTDGDGEVSAEEQRAYESKEQYKNMDKDGDGDLTLDEIRAAEKEMDTDGDGKVSDEERAKWNDKASRIRKHKAKTDPGTPGNTPPVADWDKDGDGVPDNGWQTSCWQCCAGEKTANECHSGHPGNCDDNGSCKISEICHPANETHDGKEYECHTCEHITDQPDWCREKGYSSDPACRGKCEPQMCVSIDVDINSGRIVPPNKTRKRGSTRQCYQCLPSSCTTNTDCYTGIGTCNQGTCVSVGDTVQTEMVGMQLTGDTSLGETSVGLDQDQQIFTDGFESGDTSAWSSTTQQTAGTNQTLTGLTHLGGTALQEAKDEFCDEEMGGYGYPDCLGRCKPNQYCARGGTALLMDLGPVTCYYCQERAQDNRPSILLPDGRVMRVDRVEITYVIVIIETPYGRFVLKRASDRERPFTPKQIMALAQVNPQGLIKNIAGQWVNPKEFLKGFANRFAGGMPNMKTISLKDLAGRLKDSLEPRGKYGQNCFNDFAQDVKERADAIQQALTSPVETVMNKAMAAAMSPIEKAMSAGQAAGTPAPTGPTLACGEIDGNKALGFFDAGGTLINTITGKYLKDNPMAVLDSLRNAQAATEDFLRIDRDKVAALGKFAGLGPKPKTEPPAPAAPEPAGKKKKKKKKKKQEAKPVVPNDPFYEHVAKKKGKLLGVLGGSAPKPVLGGGGGGKFGISLGGMPKREKGEEVKDQYTLRQIGFTPMDDPDSAWNVVDANAKNILVAVIDSGFDLTHEDFPQYIWTNPGEVPDNGIDDDKNGLIDDVHGWNFLNENNNMIDIRGHGTFVAGVIAAKYNNGVGIAGINPGAVILPIKVANEEGETDSFSIYRAINYAVDNGARIINISLGARVVSALEQVAIDRAYAYGALVVISSGNGGESLIGFGPSSSQHALAVGATNMEGIRSVISNFGPNNGLLAPGDTIYSLCSKDNKTAKPSDRGGYITMTGTSFSAPMVTGTASLMLARNPDLTNTQLTDILMGTAVDLDPPGWDDENGAGMLNAAAALRAAPDGYLTVMFTDLKFNYDQRKRLESVDVFATVRGPVKDIAIELGKGKRAKKFKPVAEGLQGPLEYGFLGRIDAKEYLRGSDDWILRIKATDTAGTEKFATMSLEIE